MPPRNLPPPQRQLWHYLVEATRAKEPLDSAKVAGFLAAGADINAPSPWSSFWAVTRGCDPDTSPHPALSVLLDLGLNPLSPVDYVSSVSSQDPADESRDLFAIFSALVDREVAGKPSPRAADGSNFLHAVAHHSPYHFSLAVNGSRHEKQREVCRRWLGESRHDGKTPAHVLWKAARQTQAFALLSSDQVYFLWQSLPILMAVHQEKGKTAGNPEASFLNEIPLFLKEGGSPPPSRNNEVLEAVAEALAKDRKNHLDEALSTVGAKTGKFPRF